MTLHSGGRSHWLIDANEIFKDTVLRKVVLDLWEVNLNRRPGPPYFVSIPTGGDCWAEAIAARMEAPWCRIEEFTPALLHDEYVYLVDDVCTTGTSLFQARLRLIEHGVHEYGTLIVVSRGPELYGMIPWSVFNNLPIEED